MRGERPEVRGAARRPASLLPWLLAAVLGCIAAPVCRAQDEDRAPLETGAPLDEVTGIVIDRTITLIGRDFYRNFSEYRRLNHPDSAYNLTILERPSARWGSLVWVEYNSKTLFRSFLSPRRVGQEEVAERAAEQVEEKLEKLRLQEALSDRFDVGKDEF
jgi:curli production assembly/transport component CsgE